MVQMVIIDIPYPANCKECKLREIFPGYNQCVVDAKRILDIHCRPAYCPIKAEVKQRVQKKYQDPYSYTEKIWWEEV